MSKNNYCVLNFKKDFQICEIKCYNFGYQKISEGDITVRESP